MDHLKRIFQCANPCLHSSPDNYSGHSRGVSEMESSSAEPVKELGLFQIHYKQQHLASLAENRAMFELQKQWLEKRIQHINQLKIPDLGQKVLQIEEKLEILRGDAEWVKFE